MNDNQIFINNLQLETRTEFRANGDIHIYPCDFEVGQQIVAGGADRVRQKGRMMTDDDGTSHFIRYRQNSGHRYTPLLLTEHGEVKASRRDIIVQLRYPKKLGIARIERLFLNETEKIGDFLINNIWY